MTNPTSQNATPGITTYRIDFSRKCPSVEPIREEGFVHGGQHFTPAALTILGKAIDAGIFYTDEVKQYCFDMWQAEYPATDHCLTRNGSVDHQEISNDPALRKEAVKCLREAIQAAPRGTWGLLLVRWQYDDGEPGQTWIQIISDGHGGSYDPQTGPIAHAGRIPCYEDALKGMVGYEIYKADGAEKERREQARSRAIIRDVGLTAGGVLRDITLGGKKYSTATIVSITDAGIVTLELTKRGSRNRWRWSGFAQIIKSPALPTQMPAYGEMVVDRG